MVFLAAAAAVQLVSAALLSTPRRRAVHISARIRAGAARTRHY